MCALLWFTVGNYRGACPPAEENLRGLAVSSTIHVLVMTPVIFIMMKTRELKKGKLKYSGMEG